MDIFSDGDRLIFIRVPHGDEHSRVASLSASSFPLIPTWLGIHSMVVRVPLDLRLAIVSLIPWSDSLFPGADEAIELTADLESQ